VTILDPGFVEDIAEGEFFEADGFDDLRPNIEVVDDAEHEEHPREERLESLSEHRDCIHRIQDLMELCVLYIRQLQEIEAQR